MRFYNIEDDILASPMTRVFYIIGARGVGKSYSVKKHVLHNFFKYGQNFIYRKKL